MRRACPHGDAAPIRRSALLLALTAVGCRPDPVDSKQPRGAEDRAGNSEETLPDYLDPSLPEGLTTRGLLRVKDDAREPAADLANSMISVVVEAETVGETVRLAPGGELRSGDSMWLDVTFQQKAHVYVFQVFADGTSALLFPLPADGDPAYPPGTSLRIPPKGEILRLDPNTGAERLFVVASEKQLAAGDKQLSALVNRVQSGGARFDASDSTPDELAASYRKRARFKSHRKPHTQRAATKPAARASEPIATFGTLSGRGVVRVRDTGTVDAKPGDDGIAVIDFRFLHTD